MFKEIFLNHIRKTIDMPTEMSRFLDILKQLIRTPSVVGAEHSFFLFLKRELEEIGFELHCMKVY